MFDSLLSQSPGNGVTEQDFRLNILNSLLQTPHKNFEPYIPLFKHISDTDPLFFVHLAAWYSENGTVRDLKQLFAAFLSTSPFGADHREAGLALLSNLPPHQVDNVLRILKGTKKGGKFTKGIATSVPRSFRTAVKDYLYTREADLLFFESAVLTSRKSMRSLYGSLRIKPGEYAQKVLFDNKPPEGSRLGALKKIANSKDSAEQARLIVENKVPYRVAVSMIQNMSAPIIAALVSTMTTQEVINNLSSLKERGAMDNTDIRSMIEEKLKKGGSDKRVSALKTRQALTNSDVDADLAKLVTDIGDKRLKSGKKIKRTTGLFIDKSASLQQAIEVGKQLAAVVAPVCVNGLEVMAFDTMVYPIKTKNNGTELSDWEQAFKGINANGGTACGAPIAKLLKDRKVVEQIIMVTDQGENHPPYLAKALKEYEKEMGVLPKIILLNVGQHNTFLERALKQEGIEVDTFTFNGDYYSLPTLIPMLAGGSRIDLLSDIMETPLPTRRIKEKETVAV